MEQHTFLEMRRFAVAACLACLASGFNPQSRRRALLRAPRASVEFEAAPSDVAPYDVEAPPADAEPDVAALKSSLLAEVASSDRGVNSRMSERTRVLDLVRALEASAAPSNETRAIEGDWRLVWTNALDVLSVAVPPFVTVGQIYQNIQSDLGEVTNVIELQPRIAPILNNWGGSRASDPRDVSTTARSSSRRARAPSATASSRPRGRGWRSRSSASRSSRSRSSARSSARASRNRCARSASTCARAPAWLTSAAARTSARENTRRGRRLSCGRLFRHGVLPDDDLRISRSQIGDVFVPARTVVRPTRGETRGGARSRVFLRLGNTQDLQWSGRRRSKLNGPRRAQQGSSNSGLKARTCQVACRPSPLDAAASPRRGDAARGPMPDMRVAWLFVLLLNGGQSFLHAGAGGRRRVALAVGARRRGARRRATSPSSSRTASRPRSRPTAT